MWSETRRSLIFNDSMIFKVYMKLKTLIGASLFKTHIYIYVEKTSESTQVVFLVKTLS